MYSLSTDDEPPENTYIQMNIILQSGHFEKQNTHSSAIIGSFSGKPHRWLFSELICKSFMWKKKNHHRYSLLIFYALNIAHQQHLFMTTVSAKWDLAPNIHPCLTQRFAAAHVSENVPRASREEFPVMSGAQTAYLE